MTKSLNLEINGFAPSLARKNPYQITGEVDSLVEYCLRVTPFDAVQAVHDPVHFASFAKHVDEIVATPIKQVEVDGRRFVQLLGMLVVELMPNGSYETYLWTRVNEIDWQAISYEPVLTTMLEFPRTDLWTENLRALLLRESDDRIGDEEMAQMWAGWAWCVIVLVILAKFDRRRVQSMVRKSLDLNWSAVSEVVRQNKVNGKEYVTFSDYNNWILGHKCPSNKSQEGRS